MGREMLSSELFSHSNEDSKEVAEMPIIMNHLPEKQESLFCLDATLVQDLLARRNGDDGERVVSSRIDRNVRTMTTNHCSTRRV